MVAEDHVVEGDLDAAVGERLAIEAGGEAEVAQQRHARVLEHTGPDAVLHVPAAALLEHDAVDAAGGEQVGEDQAGRTGAQILEPGRRARLDFRDYLIPGDVLGVEVNLTNNRILGLQVGTYIDKPEDSVSLKVEFATLTDGTGYPGQVTLDATKQNVRVVTENTGYRPAPQ